MCGGFAGGGGGDGERWRFFDDAMGVVEAPCLRGRGRARFRGLGGGVEGENAGGEGGDGSGDGSGEDGVDELSSSSALARFGSCSSDSHPGNSHLDKNSMTPTRYKSAPLCRTYIQKNCNDTKFSLPT